MKNILIFALLFSSCAVFGQTPRQIENEKAFAKVYGYVKYFYPGDEASKIDWDKFAIYGSRKVEACKTDEELKDSLNALIKVLMPGVRIIKLSDKISFDFKLLKPSNLNGYSPISWQHLGVGLIKDKPTPYQSIRTNRTTVFKSTFTGRSNAFMFKKAEALAGKDFELTGRARVKDGDGKGYLWFRVDLPDNKMGYFDNMNNRPITGGKWQTVKIQGRIDDSASGIVFGAMFENQGSFELDDFLLKVDGKEVVNLSFDQDTVGKAPTKIAFSTMKSSIQNAKYTISVQETEGNRFAVLTSPKTDIKDQTLSGNLFEKTASFGEYVEKSIGSNLKIFVPIVLYGTTEFTYPKVDTLKAERALVSINNLDLSTLKSGNLNFRIGNIINSWNVFKHFYPYFDIAKTDWEKDLAEAIQRTYKDISDPDFVKTLKYLTAKLKDGHISVSYTKDVNYYMPPIAWKWVEGKLVITAVLNEKLDLKKGDVVEKVNGEDADQYFQKINQYISAATKGYLDYRAQTTSLQGEKDSPLTITIQGNKELKLTRSLHTSDYYSILQKRETIKSLGNQIAYINIGNSKMKLINDSIPLLKNSKAIICDLRGYPTDNTDLIQYLMVKDDNSKSWMQVSEIIYPDQEKITGFKFASWGLKPKAPHLSAKIYFLIDGQAISYAESYMSFIEHYKLATIIGEPTAGTNGNVNTISLPGGYSIRFTGMKVLKHDGSQHHGVGIIPNILVSQTVKGIKENRDEVLERAIAEANK